MNKYCITILVLLSVNLANATEKGGVISVKNKNGKESTYSTDDYVVVPRRKKKPKPKTKPKEQPPKLEVEHQCPIPAPLVVEKLVIEKQELRKNTVKMYGGIGLGVYQFKVTDKAVYIYQDPQPVFGLGYSRLITDRISAEAVGLTSKIGLLGIGYSF